jgi:hypothetical protein
MRSTVVLPALLGSLFASAGVARLHAQAPLADVARKEESRRQEVKAPAKVYTNKDLAPVPPGVTPPPAPDPAKVSPGAAGAADGSKPAAGAQDPAKPKDKDAEPAKDQAYWSGRMKELQTQLARDQGYAEAMQSRINALTTDFAARDDPAQRGAVGSDRQKAVNELNRLKLAIVNDQKAIAALAEEARRAGVPPGWLR